MPRRTVSSRLQKRSDRRMSGLSSKSGSQAAVSAETELDVEWADARRLLGQQRLSAAARRGGWAGDQSDTPGKFGEPGFVTESVEQRHLKLRYPHYMLLNGLLQAGK
jgi:hypothetical protein